MKKSKENYIGLELGVNQWCIDSDTINLLKVSEKVNEGGVCYSTITGDKMTKESLNDLMSNGISNLQASLVSRSENELRRAGVALPSIIDMHRNAIITDLEKLKSKIESIHETISSIRFGRPTGTTISLDDITIINGEAVITDENKEEIRLRHTIKIENENQAEFYQSYLDLKKSFDHFADLKNRMIGSNSLIIDYYKVNAVLNLDELEHLEMEMNVLTCIK